MNAEKYVEVFELDKEKLKLADYKTAMSEYATCVIEARLLSAILDTTITADKRKAKINSHMQKMGVYATLFECNLERQVMARIMVESVTQVTASTVRGAQAH
eukprot:6490864-Amphidinium_carterae.2